MARGKYASRAQTRLQELESEALREANSKIRKLESDLAAAKREASDLYRDAQAKAMRLAGGLSRDDKEQLRRKIASLEYVAVERKIKYATVTCEALIHQALNFGQVDPGSDEFTDALVEIMAAVEGIFALTDEERARVRSLVRPHSDANRRTRREYHDHKLIGKWWLRAVSEWRAWADSVYRARLAGDISDIPLPKLFKGDRNALASRGVHPDTRGALIG